MMTERRFRSNPRAGLLTDKNRTVRTTASTPVPVVVFCGGDPARLLSNDLRAVPRRTLRVESLGRQPAVRVGLGILFGGILRLWRRQVLVRGRRARRSRFAPECELRLCVRSPASPRH